MSVIDYQKIMHELNQSAKPKYICLSTTANINNKELIFTSLRETKSSIAANFIFRNDKFLHEIIQFFDGKVESFLIDTEIKNEFHDLAEKSISQIKHSKAITYKPNDFTISALDAFLSVKFTHLLNKNILIVGSGNIGIKTALLLAEKGAQIWLYGRNCLKTAKIIEGLNLFQKGKHSIIQVIDKSRLNNMDIAIGCSPGIPVIDEEICKNTKECIIDAGNGTISKNAIELATKKNIPIYVLSSLPGYIGYIENLEKTIATVELIKSKKISPTNSLLTTGLLGAYGDIIVDNIDDIKRIIAVCDGNGDVLYQSDAEKEIIKITEQMQDKKLANQIKKLYFP